MQPGERGLLEKEPLDFNTPSKGAEKLERAVYPLGLVWFGKYNRNPR